MNKIINKHTFQRIFLCNDVRKWINLTFSYLVPNIVIAMCLEKII